MEKNIYLENRNIIHHISKTQQVDAGVALSMFDEDLRNGTKKYAEYTEELRAEYKAMDNEQLTAQTSGFYEEYERCIKAGEPFIHN